MKQSPAHAIFVIDLLQDFNILRPLACLAAAETEMRLTLMVSRRFIERDQHGIWTDEIKDLAIETGAAVVEFHSDFEAHSYLSGKHGIIFAGSESNLNAHTTSHNIFRYAPTSFLRVTLQHGFECVGFLQNREQSIAFGENIRFAADIVCGWMPIDRMAHLQSSERDKLISTGPTSRLIAGRQTPRLPAPSASAGLVCENLHSVRMNVVGDFKASYMDTFFSFAHEMNKAGRRVSLRPHPGGQYVIRNAVKLPSNVDLHNEPMYRVDLSRYAYGISAPSSVLIDMVMAGIPTAVWHDGEGRLDTGNYAGLTHINSVEEWQSFAEAAIADPAPFLHRQRAFLDQTGIVVEAEAVRASFLDLLRAAQGKSEPRRILFLANSEIPTLQLGFLKPLHPLVDAGQIEILLVTEAEMRAKYGKPSANPKQGKAWALSAIEAFRPDIAIFCRYSGPHVDPILAALHKHGVPVIFHIDDDLLNVPVEIGAAKHKEHNKPERLATVTTLLRSADLVYCSTGLLLERFGNLGFDTERMLSGAIYCSAEVMTPAVERPVRKIGYMGFDHAHDFELVLPDLIQFLRERREIQFELFGSIPKPTELDEFGDRVTVVPPVRPYSAFLEEFARREWDIGICPLAKTEFNIVKANTKWVEYSCVGAAVIATSGMAYDECCSEGCGILLEDATGWREAMHALCDDPARRFRMVSAAQARIRQDYSVERLRDQVLQKIDEAIARNTTDGNLVTREPIQ